MAEHHFDMNKDCDKLNETTSQFVHHNVAKLLFSVQISMARCTDPHVIPLLKGVVWQPNKDNYKKLVQVMRYLRNTQDMVLTLEADNFLLIFFHYTQGHEEQH